jgi:hypothetical protein
MPFFLQSEAIVTPFPVIFTVMTFIPVVFFGSSSVTVVVFVAVKPSLFHYLPPVFVIPFVVVPAVIVLSEVMSQPAVVSTVPTVAVVEIGIVVKPQIVVVVIKTAAAQRNEPCPGNEYKMGPPDITIEDICRDHKGGAAGQYEVDTAPGMTVIIDRSVIPVKVIDGTAEPVLKIGIVITIIVVVPVIVVTESEPGKQEYQNKHCC